MLTGRRTDTKWHAKVTKRRAKRYEPPTRKATARETNTVHPVPSMHLLVEPAEPGLEPRSDAGLGKVTAPSLEIVGFGSQNNRYFYFWYTRSQSRYLALEATHKPQKGRKSPNQLEIPEFEPLLFYMIEFCVSCKIPMSSFSWYCWFFRSVFVQG